MSSLHRTVHLRRLAAARRRTAAGLAVVASLGLAACKDEKTRLPFTTVMTPTSVVTGPTPIFFSVSDRQGNQSSLDVRVSRDAGLTFTPATPVAGNPANPVVGGLPTGATGFFFWDPIEDLGPGIHREVVISAAAFQGGSGVAGTTAIFTVDLTDRVDAPAEQGTDERAVPLAAPLPDDRVWVTGGTRGGAPASGGIIYDPVTDEVVTAPGLSTPREEVGWALLRGGQVLVAGGRDGGAAPSAVAETFVLTGSGSTGAVTAVGPLGTARIAPAVAALADGRALIIGGEDAGGSAVSQTEVFTPAPGGGGTFAAGALNDPLLARRGATATTLPDGRVLVLGGVDGTGAPVTQGALIDAAGTSVTATATDAPRTQHAAVLLPDGRVAAIGGSSVLDDPAAANPFVSIYDPTTDTFTQAILQHARHRPGAVYAGGFLVVFGGSNGQGAVAEAERVDPDTLQVVEIAGPHGATRADAVAVASGPGRALIVGGEEPPEVYTSDASLTVDPFDPLLGEDAVPAPRADHTATLLGDGSVLLVGGTDGVQPLDTAQRFVPLTDTFEDRAAMDRPRTEHVAALTQGLVLVAGGRDAGGLVAEAELYDPGADVWIDAGDLSVPRAGATAVTLGDGTVLVSGGVDGTGVAVAVQERWNPSTRTFSNASPLSEPRAEHRATDFEGHAVVGPGFDDVGAPQATADVVLSGGQVVRTAAGGGERAAAGVAVPANSGRIAVLTGGEDAGGPRDDAALLDLGPVPGADPVFLSGTRPLRVARSRHESVALFNGNDVLLVGGRGLRGGLVDAGELFHFTPGQIQSGRGRLTDDPRTVKARLGHTATRLNDGRVLIVGGFDERGVAIAGAEVFR